MTQSYLTRARVVLPDRTLEEGALLLEDGHVAAVCPASKPSGARETDLSGAFLLPGLVDLHCDAIESVAEPRPGSFLPFDHAAAEMDRVAALCGITTFYNAVSFAGEELGLRNDAASTALVAAIQAHRAHALVDQRIHCRFEVTYGKALPEIIGYIDRSLCQLVSYMDHSPGQGQFRDEQAYRDYMSTRYGYDDEMIDGMLAGKKRAWEAVETDLNELAAAARAANISLAGHDSDSSDHVATMTRLGAVLAEFPMNRLAARAGVEAGLHQSVGSTNVVRGRSQRSGMPALEVIAEGLADCLCSDYVPSTLLPAVFKVSRELSVPLEAAVKLASTNPAAAAGLTDRGKIAVGLRADLVAVRSIAGQPRVERTWSAGVPVFASRSPYLLG